MKILIATEKPFASEAVEGIKKVVAEGGHELSLLEKYTEKAQLLEAVKDADALIIRSDKIDAVVLNAAPKLKIAVRAGAGYDNVDLAAATAHNVVVENTPGQNSNAVAELVFGMLVAAVRNFYNGKSGTELMGKTLGILAFGNVGRNVARIARGFGMNILAYDAYCPAEVISQTEGVSAVASTEELFAKSDIVSLHIPATPETIRSIGTALVGRGSIHIKLGNKESSVCLRHDGLVHHKAIEAIRLVGIDNAIFERAVVVLPSVVYGQIGIMSYEFPLARGEVVFAGHSLVVCGIYRNVCPALAPHPVFAGNDVLYLKVFYCIVFQVHLKRHAFLVVDVCRVFAADPAFEHIGIASPTLIVLSRHTPYLSVSREIGVDVRDERAVIVHIIAERTREGSLAASNGICEAFFNAYAVHFFIESLYFSICETAQVPVMLLVGEVVFICSSHAELGIYLVAATTAYILVVVIRIGNSPKPSGIIIYRYCVLFALQGHEAEAVKRAEMGVVER